MPDELRIELDTDVAECGGLVSGIVHCGLQGDNPCQIVTQLKYVTEGKGDIDTAVVDQVVTSGTGGEEGHVELRVPGVGPISFVGSMMRVSWEVVAHRRDQQNLAVSVGITVLPRGGSAVWAQQVGAPPSV